MDKNIILLFSLLLVNISLPANRLGEIDSLLNLIETTELSPSEQAEVQFELCKNYYTSEQVTLAFESGYKAEKIFEELGDLPGVAKVHELYGNLHKISGDYGETIYWFTSAMKVYESTDDSSNIFRISLNMGLTFEELDNFKQTIYYYNKAIRFNPNQPLTSAFLHLHLGIYYLEIDSLPMALHSFRVAERHYLDSMLVEGIATTKLNLGVYLYKKEEWDSAMTYFLDAEKLFQSEGLHRGEAAAVLNMGEIYLETHQYALAESRLLKSLRMAREIGDMKIQLNALESLVLTTEKDNRFQEALEYQTSLSILKDSLNYQSSSLKSRRFENMYELRRYQEQSLLKIQSLENKKSIAQYRLVVIIGISLLAFLTFAFLIYRTRVQRRIVKMELENTNRQRKRLRDELKFKNKELIHSALYIVKKNEFLQNMELKLKSSTVSPTTSIKSVNSLICRNLSIDKDLKELELRVQKINQSFFYRLDRNFPDLTEKDRRLASFLLLGLSSKEISSMLNVTIASVEKSRYRLRKKLRLHSKINMTNFLKRI